jgi:hypothetical protein
MIHFIGWAAHWYVWLIIVLLKVEWWVLHCRPLLIAAISWDLLAGTVGRLARQAWWFIIARPIPPEDEPCS